MGLFDRLFNKKPKNLPEQIESYYEDAIRKVLKNGFGPMETLLITNQIVTTTNTLKEIYSDIHRQLGYSKAQYEKLVDEICSKVVDRYFPNNSKDNDYIDDDTAFWEE